MPAADQEPEEPTRDRVDASDGAPPSGSPADDRFGGSDGETSTRSGRIRTFAARLDSHESLLSVTGLLRRELPGDASFGDPLSTAGRQPASLLARRVSALQPARRSVLQELGLAGLQVWQSVAESAGRGRGDRSLAILFTDLVGHSAWALQAGDEVALRLLREVGTCAERAITRHDGHIVKRLGDGLMATFLSADEAVDAALEACAAVAGVDLDGHRPALRAGLHWGAPRKLGGDYLGVDVNIAARVCEAAKDGEVLVSDALLACLPDGELSTGRSRRLRAPGAPRELRVVSIKRD